MNKKIVANKIRTIGGIPYQNLDSTQAFAALTGLAQHPLDLTKLTPADSGRVAAYNVSGSGLSLNFAFKQVTYQVLAMLQALANEMKLIEKYHNLLNGEVINTTEQRKVLHPHTRGDLSSHVPGFDKDAYHWYQQQLNRIFDFAEKVHSGQILGSTGKQFKHIVHIGIGGSDLGPKAAYEALERYVAQLNLSEGGEFATPMTVDFVSNVDPDDINYVLQKLIYQHRDKLENVMFVVVSKSGTTLETLTNEQIAEQAATHNGIDITKHIVAVTGEGSPLDNPAKYLASFYIDDSIGGRYSTSSAIGSTVLSLAFGPEIVKEIHQGMHAGDINALNPDITQNTALMGALLAVWDRVFLGYPMIDKVAYAQPLGSMIAHHVQTDPESLGKSVNVWNEFVNYMTGRVVLGGVGTNRQHADFQLRHQGTTPVPMEFTIFGNPQLANDIVVEGTTSQQKLMANIVAQMVAMATGRQGDNPSKVFPGNRPSSLIYANQLTPFTLGRMFAHLEHEVMFQGNLFNVDPWDQPGVEFGKSNATALLDVVKGEKSPEKIDPFLAAMAGQIGLLP